MFFEALNILDYTRQFYLLIYKNVGVKRVTQRLKKRRLNDFL